jgi:drug/metabolite transporter (DMT)-like permease
MSLHRPSGHWQRGLALSLLTVFLWGGLPIALKVVLGALDPATLTWFRFLLAGLCMAGFLAARRQLGRYRAVERRGWLLLAVASLGLAANYYYFQVGLSRTSPATAQVLIQLSPVLFLLLSVWIFKESFVTTQRVGLVALLAGLALYFHHRLGDFASGGDAFVAGVGAILLAGVAWAVYALAQKQLLTTLPSPAIMAVIYLASAAVTAPAVHLDHIVALDRVRAAILLYAALNTVVAYGAFAEALAHWEASRVSAVLALTPVMTLTLAALGHWLWPDLVAAENLTPLSYVGAALVVGGSIVTSLPRSPRPALGTAPSPGLSNPR